ncbi:MAG: hypothetical protein HQ518_05775 [Rhodopirellula sp.]|nr:hypothetical protein [Rhodopirellula sp.]
MANDAFWQAPTPKKISHCFVIVLTALLVCFHMDFVARFTVVIVGFIAAAFLSAAFLSFFGTFFFARCVKWVHTSLELVVSVSVRIVKVLTIPNWPDTWELFSYCLPQNTRERVFEPSREDMLKRYRRANRKYKNKAARFILNVAWTFRFALLAACPDTHSDLVFVGEMLYSGFS